jgi:hypothetical protein
MNVDFGEIPIARYRAHDCPLLVDTKAFVWKAGLRNANQCFLAFSRSGAWLSGGG